MYCPKCGTENPDNATSCTMCGEVFRRPEGPAPGAMPPPPTQAPFTPAPPRPPNYLVWSILTTILCCLPAGIVSIVYAAQVDGKYSAGDYAGAADSSNKARTWAWVSFGVGLVGVIIYGVLMAVGMMTGISHQ